VTGCVPVGQGLSLVRAPLRSNLGPLFTPMCFYHQAVYWPDSCEVNNYTMQYTSSISMVSQCKLVSACGMVHW